MAELRIRRLAPLEAAPAKDRLAAVFGQTAYCGGTPPPKITVVHAVVVQSEPLTLATTNFM